MCILQPNNKHSMTNSEKIITLKRLFVTANNLCASTEQLINQGNLNEADVDKAIACMDEMIALLPINFPAGADGPVLLLNLKDPEDEPTQIVPGQTRVLQEASLLVELEDWKFLHWNVCAIKAPEKSSREKYKALMSVQAEKCLTFLKDDKNLPSAEKNRLIVYANQIGWRAFEDDNDPVKLEQALQAVERGFVLSSWREHKYIKDTKVRLLLKLGRPAETYPIIFTAFERDKNYRDFQDLKTDENYVHWANAETQRLEEVHRELLKTVTDQFINPNHPLVQKHAATLNGIKQRMATFKMKDLRRKMQNNEPILNGYEANFTPRTWSVPELEAFEQAKDLRLPEEYKVYLMEIGSGGDIYFHVGGVPGIDDPNAVAIDRMKKNFPITADKIHDVGSSFGVKAWVYSDSTDWIAEGLLPKGTDMKALFGLPQNAAITDGCLFLGNSRGHNELYVVMNGEFANEVWTDTLQYGAEARGCYGAASTKRLTLLEFIRESVQAQLDGMWNASEAGDWL
jgi:hypothetical protein